MKFATAIVTLLFPAFAFANPAEVLQCTTPGDALDYVNIGVNGAGDLTDTVLMTVGYMSEETKTLSVPLPKGQLAAQLGKGNIKLILKGADSVEFGGSISDAALLVLKKNKHGKYEGELAMDGAVNILKCL